MKIHFISLGCKTNQYETNAMEQKFIEKGYDLAEDGEKADIYVVNTCSVTNIAERKSRQKHHLHMEIHRLSIRRSVT